MEEARDTILEYGREMLDLIITSYTALVDFSSQLELWKASRKQLIDHFDTLVKNLEKCAQRKATYAEILRTMNGCVAAVDAIPHPVALATGRLIAVITGVFSTIFAANSRGIDAGESNSISTAVLGDVRASGDLYAAGLLCHQQFERTADFVEAFHDVARGFRYDDSENGEMSVFVAGVLEYKPRHRTFYPKLHEHLRELLNASSGGGGFSRRFCEPLSLNPSAVEVVRFLNWRFRYQEFNPESVRFGMKQLRALLQQNENNEVSIEDLLANVRGLLDLLKDELNFIETCVRDVESFNSHSC